MVAVLRSLAASYIFPTLVLDHLSLSEQITFLLGLNVGGSPEYWLDAKTISTVRIKEWKEICDVLSIKKILLEIKHDWLRKE